MESLSKAVSSIQDDIKKFAETSSDKKIPMNERVTWAILKFYTSGSIVDHDVVSSSNPPSNTAPTSIDNVEIATKVLHHDDLPRREELISYPIKASVNAVNNIQAKPASFVLLQNIGEYATKSPHKHVISHCTQPSYNSRNATEKRITPPLQHVFTDSDKSTNLSEHYVVHPCVIYNPETHPKPAMFAQCNQLPTDNSDLNSCLIFCPDRETQLKFKSYALPIFADEFDNDVDEFFEFSTGLKPEEFFKHNEVVEKAQMAKDAAEQDDEEEGIHSSEKTDTSEVRKLLALKKMLPADRNSVLISMALAHFSSKYQGFSTVFDWIKLKYELANRLLAKGLIQASTLDTLCHGQECNDTVKFADAYFVPCLVLMQANFRVRLCFVEGNNRANAITHGILNVPPLLGLNNNDTSNFHSKPEKSLFSSGKTIDLHSISCNSNLAVCWTALQSRPHNPIFGNEIVSLDSCCAPDPRVATLVFRN